ncbi:hypothetical protein A2318_00645 [Candidatus Uhrbacteria bacterium RIFOXYB2_FULL_45_11]|uniref:Uncharacterized protein n=1 Tax=Candidatus Uhrbacteria bacterium RIFOXYB2_FULL_45_11 TaxID=1802421 RepID=A0A1F7W148_9BACT|nr:MAG: hypothetical protein A2318_00645 [Candidatus Uhrbacteria bacterium RIFOXYB2_FULL_45_11]
MSANNMLEIFRMDNGQFWIMNMQGDCPPEFPVSGFVVSKCASLGQALERLDYISTEEFELGYIDAKTGDVVWTGELYYNDDYVYSEIMVSNSPETIMERSAMLLQGEISVLFGDRACSCFDERDLLQHKWKVVLKARIADPGTVLAENLSYVIAMNFARVCFNQQIGEFTLNVPLLFREFEDYQNHVCEKDEYNFNTEPKEEV